MAFGIKSKKPKMKRYAIKIGNDVNIVEAKDKKDLDRKLKDGIILWNYSWKW
jgi:hypothetical protein